MIINSTPVSMSSIPHLLKIKKLNIPAEQIHPHFILFVIWLIIKKIPDPNPASTTASFHQASGAQNQISDIVETIAPAPPIILQLKFFLFLIIYNYLGSLYS